MPIRAIHPGASTVYACAQTRFAVGRSVPDRFGQAKKDTMNIAIWIMSGAVLGWFFFTVLNANAGRGMILSIVIGVIGGFFGGNVLAPLLGAIADKPNDFSLISLVLALVSAAACLVIGDQIAKRMDI
jgi:uncharacterized membrane protein YeaQ/YmgE (transglycosylase-associated protein family)